MDPDVAETVPRVFGLLVGVGTVGMFPDSLALSPSEICGTPLYSPFVVGPKSPMTGKLANSVPFPEVVLVACPVMMVLRRAAWETNTTAGVDPPIVPYPTMTVLVFALLLLNLM